ncbi:Permease of the drug/metabolite transporter (DMT) superfamily [Xaviernesmea oryzae]|uniref:Permease of the drug/metabolite transporter (DMT) superfamily n=1 Tax=Xaviernesmea oryzae TaxID=464029 RepID=A0A1X7FAX7_9HYPH|nr:DMT family transporter [Xaviernesmea oryzae]SMF49318.1 Permease of the drug/metabolite transporter (DMT) superfamily [Xaviernesmea oryzae]
MAADALNPLRGIMFKVSSVVIFVMMQTCIKSAGPDIPAGQITFYRSAFALVPIMAYLAVQSELRGSLHTDSLSGHLKRGFLGILSMICGFYGLVHLPMPDAIAIGYSSPLLAVVFAAIFLKETVRVYRWTAVMVGMVGVVIISWPKLTMFEDGGMGSEQAMGAAAVLLSAVLAGFAMIQTRQLVRTEKTATIVLYFSLTAALFSLLSLPFGWVAPTASETLFLIGAGFCGGIGQIFLTESYRNADVSTVAPFEYTSILLGIGIAYVLFGDVPTVAMLVGTAITVSAGIFIIYREHQLGLERKAARKASPPGA